MKNEIEPRASMTADVVVCNVPKDKLQLATEKTFEVIPPTFNPFADQCSAISGQKVLRVRHGIREPERGMIVHVSKGKGFRLDVLWDAHQYPEKYRWERNAFRGLGGRYSTDYILGVQPQLAHVK